jgi:HK97 family phage portal protein
MPPLPALRKPASSMLAAPLRLAAAIGRVFQAAAQDGTGGRVMNSRQLWEAMLGSGQITESGALINDATVMTVGEIYACLRLLSSSIAMLPLNLVSVGADGAEEVAADHPVQRLVSVAPNRRQTPFEFVQMIMVHKLLYGNFYALVTRSRGQVVEIWPLNPRRVQVEEQDDGSILYKYAGPKGQTETFYEEEILHIRGMTRDGILGESTVMAAKEDAGLAIRMRTYAGKLFANGTRPSGVYKVPGQLSDESFARLQQQLRDFSSAENAGKTMILDGGAEWSKISLDAEEAQYIQGRQFTRSQIGMFFGVPPQMLGDLAGSTTWGSGMAQQGKGFLLYVVRPHIVNICQALDKALLTADERAGSFTGSDQQASRQFRHRIDTHELTEGDAEAMSKIIDTYIKNGVLNPNEGRRRLGLNPREGGDAYAAGPGTTTPALAKPAAPATPAPSEKPAPKDKPTDAAT